MRFDPKRYASFGEVQSARIHRIFEYWRSKASAGQLPRRAAIDPIDLAEVLSCLIIVEVIEDRFRYRLVGTEVAANAGGDFTGAFLDEQNFANRDFYLACYRDVRAHGKPMFGLDHWAYSDGRNGVAEFAMLPLAFEGNDVAQILTVEDTKEFDAAGL
jgi:hypothetical protein